jgi:hypothetical protein
MTSILGKRISGECLAIPDQSHLLNSGVLGGMAVVLFLATREDKLLALYGQWTHDLLIFDLGRLVVKIVFLLAATG